MKLPAIRINPLGVCVLFGLLVFFIFMYSGRNSSRNRDVYVSLKQLLAFGISAAEAGGAKVREIRMSSDLKETSKGKTKEGANELLTAGDLESHKIMVHSFRTAFPKLQIISEEHDDPNGQTDSSVRILPQWEAIKKITDDIDIPTSDVLVWIDPLDATQEYTEKLTEYVTTMVCVVVRGKPVIGIIHLPFKNSTVWAWVNHGTSDQVFEELANERKTKAGSENTQNIIVSRSHAGKVSDVAKEAFGPSTNIISAGGAGYKSLQVAFGKADAYIHVTLIKKWDICAGNALLNAINGQMTTLDGELIDYGNPKDVKNSKGLLATRSEHSRYLEKLSSLKN